MLSSTRTPDRWLALAVILALCLELFGAAVSPALAQEGNVAIVNTGALNIRSGPGVQYAVLTAVPGGTRLSPTGRHPTRPWLRVAGDFGVGWVMTDFIIFRGDWNAVPEVTEPVGALEVPLAIIAVPHNVYDQPRWNTRVGAIQPGLYPIVAWSPAYAWAQLETPLGRVWIHNAEFALRGIAANAPIVR